MYSSNCTFGAKYYGVDTSLSVQLSEILRRVELMCPPEPSRWSAAALSSSSSPCFAENLVVSGTCTRLCSPPASCDPISTLIMWPNPDLSRFPRTIAKWNIVVVLLVVSGDPDSDPVFLRQGQRKSDLRPSYSRLNSNLGRFTCYVQSTHPFGTRCSCISTTK
jgi:hypothetical protein